MPKTPIRFTLNGAETGVFANSGANLLDVLRREAGDLTPKQGCAQGGCGACSVMIDGELHLRPTTVDPLDRRAGEHRDHRPLLR